MVTFSTLPLRICGTHLEHSIAWKAVIWSVLHWIWHTFKALPFYIATHTTTRQNLKWQQARWVQAQKVLISFFSPLYIGESKNLKFSEEEFLTSSEEKGAEKASVGHFLTVPWLWHMSVSFWRMGNTWLSLENLNQYFHLVRILNRSGD